MIVVQLKRRLGFLAGLVFLFGIVASPVAARTIVDLKTAAPLGELIIDESKGVALYSLGNGRAIKYSLQTVQSQSPAKLRQLLLHSEGVAPALSPTLRRNSKWRR